MRPRARTLSPLLLLLLPSCIPSTYVVLPAVRGRVVGADRAPVPHVTLTVSKAGDHSTVVTFTTDADGRFSHPPIARVFLYFPGMDFYLPQYTLSLAAGSCTTPPASAPLGPEAHVFALTASDTPLDLGDLTFVSPARPLVIPRRPTLTTKPAVARAATSAPVVVPTAGPASRPVRTDPDPEFTAWLGDNAPDKLYPPGTLRAEILRRFPHPRLKGGMRVHDVYHRSPLGVGRPVDVGLPVEVRARAVVYDDFGVIRLIGSAQLVFVDRVLYDADGRVLGTERHHAR